MAPASATPETHPAVSVVIAAFQNDAFLTLAVRSALAQTFTDFEIIVSDDAASGETHRLVESFADARAVYRSNPVPAGPAGNHRAAFRDARGELIAILNHDDSWEPGFLAALVPPLERDPDVVVSFCDHGVIDEEGKVLESETAANTAKWGRGRLAVGTHRPFFDLVVGQTLPVAMGAVFRKSVLTMAAFPDEVGPAYDLWLAYLLGRTGQGACYCPDRLSHWRVHRQSLTVGRDEAWARGSAFCWRAVADDPAFAEFRLEARRKMAFSYLAAALANLRCGDRRQARHFAAKAWAGHRGIWKAPAAWVLSLLPHAIVRLAIK